jgi:thiamine pyrophosphate-dependent acetolactate synthase large subunit-like protein
LNLPVKIVVFRNDSLDFVELEMKAGVGRALVHRQELPMPPTITIEQATGFGMFMLKAVISGRGDELVDLAKVNLFR